VAEAVASEGDDYPVGLYFPPGGDPGSLVNASGIAVLGTSKRKQQALELIEYLLGRSARRTSPTRPRSTPSRPACGPDPALEPLSRIEQPDIDLADLDDLQGSVKLIQEAGSALAWRPGWTRGAPASPPPSSSPRAQARAGGLALPRALVAAGAAVAAVALLPLV
jgi:hypothetical protein